MSKEECNWELQFHHHRWMKTGLDSVCFTNYNEQLV